MMDEQSISDSLYPDLEGLGDDPHQSYSRSRGGEVEETVHISGSSRGVILWNLHEDVEGAEGGRPAFALKKLIARGGMGEVWESRQQSLSRAVAVKQIRPDLINEYDRQRLYADFRQEALIAGKLEHPNIVPVHDLGHDEQGAPLIAMKLVQGISWDRMLRQDFEELDAEVLLSRHLPILILMAQAVAFAHSKGVIHRDLKPSQVIVGEFGEALLMDWGLAITIDETQNASISTRDIFDRIPTPATASSPAGTPAMMAPEQTLRHARDIGPWTDIYLLGGTLYYLLTGTYIHEARTATIAVAKAVAGVIQHPRERSPGRHIPDELCDLCMQAMAKSPSDRTPSARDFVKALQEFLSGAPKRRESLETTAKVAAMLDRGAKDYNEFGDGLAKLENAAGLWPANPNIEPLRERVLREYASRALAAGDLLLARIEGERLNNPSERTLVLERVGRAEIAARNRSRQRKFALVTTFFLIGALAFIAIIFTLSLNREADRAHRSEKAALEQKLLAEASALKASQARDEADDLVRYMIGDLSVRLLPADPNLDILEDVGSRAAKYYVSRARESGKLKEEELEDLHASLLAICELFSTRGKTESAKELYEMTFGLGEEQLAAHNGSTAWKERLARTHASRGNFYQDSGLPGPARLDVEESIRLHLEIASAGVDSLAHQNEVARLLVTLSRIAQSEGAHAEAAGALSRAGAIVNQFSDSGVGTDVLLETQTIVELQRGKQAEYEGQYDTALTEYRAALATINRLVALSPGNPKWLDKKGEVLIEIGDRYKGKGLAKEALKVYEEALAISNQLQAQDVTISSYLRTGWLAYLQMGEVYRDTSRPDLALLSYQEASMISHRMLVREPKNLAWQFDLAQTLSRIARVQSELGASNDSLQALTQALAMERPLTERYPENISWKRQMANDLFVQGNVLVSLGQLAQSSAALRESVEIGFELDQQGTAYTYVLSGLADHLEIYASVLLEQGKPQDAFEVFAEMEDIGRRLSEQNTEHVPFLQVISHARIGMGHCQAILGNKVNAEGWFGSAEQIAREALSREMWNFELWHDLASLEQRRAELDMQQGDLDSAAARIARAHDQIEYWLEPLNCRPCDREILQEQCRAESRLFVKLGELGAAEAASREAVALSSQCLVEGPSQMRALRQADCRAALADILASSGRLDEARIDAAAALEVIAPSLPQLRGTRYEAALKKACILLPDDPDAARILKTIGDQPQWPGEFLMKVEL